MGFGWVLGVRKRACKALGPCSTPHRKKREAGAAGGAAAGESRGRRGPNIRWEVEICTASLRGGEGVGQVGLV